MAGKILGVLLIADRRLNPSLKLAKTWRQQKFRRIMARLLVENGLIERVASPLPRRDYYRFKEGGWVLYMRQWLALMHELHKIAERGLALLEEKPDEMKERLLEAHDLFSMLEERFPILLEYLEKERKQRIVGNSG